MRIEVLRKGSLGLKGTYANAKHHAPELYTLVKELRRYMRNANMCLKPDFARWLQGNNVHVFETKDGRRFVLRPLNLKGEGYVGITLAQRLSRSHEVHLMTIYYDFRNALDPVRFLQTLCLLAEPSPNNILTSEGKI